VSPTGSSKAGRWQASPYSYGQAHALSQELGVSTALASVLVRRGHGDPVSARLFLDAAETHDPFEFQGMNDAVAKILDHVGRSSEIAIHGDYDVDGVCSTALMGRTLRWLGATVWPRLPSRLEDGYGISARTVEQLHARGVGLLVTSDCGIGAIEEVALARKLGMDVVITDHHRPGDRLPDCPVVHPAVCGYPCPELCATGVVYKLCQALYRVSGRDPCELEDELDLVALATVADVVPLLGENRALVRNGLRALAATARPGLRALMTVAGAEPQSVKEHTIAFVLAPRINAAGRLYRADAALELLLTEDEERAKQIARELDAINTERQTVETRILFEAEGQLSAAPDWSADPVYVLAGEGWHPGVVGIVASRLVERYHRPVVLLAIEEGGRARGSGRSISAYDLHAGLAACATRLLRFGGHRMAAGVELETNQLEAFRSDLTDHARSHLQPDDLVAVERVDMIVPGDLVGLELAEELERLRPFGMGNPGVNLLLPAARVSDVRSIGEGRHARFTISSAGVRTSAVAFGSGTRLVGEDERESRHDLIARLEANEWGGAIEPRLVVNSLHLVGHPVEGDEQNERACVGCACRARGNEWWDAVWSEFEANTNTEPQVVSAGEPRTVVDSRGRGILGSLSDLVSTGEPVAAVCVDVSRRLPWLDTMLDPTRFGRPPAIIFSAHCAGSPCERSEAGERQGFFLVDYATLGREPALLARFTHVFALDPPQFERLDANLRFGTVQPGFLHLGWGEAELEFTHKALEQEYGLRGPLAAIYRGLVKHGPIVSDQSLETALSGEGRHPRPPALIGRCLRVFSELGLVELERSSATVRCTIIEQRKVELERSRAFLAYAALHEEALRFLSEHHQPISRARAA
jgi:single-stranded-DNA-specific exonuclease